MVITFPNGAGLRFDGTTFLTGFAVPNFYFHASMTYAILRAQGVEIGKQVSWAIWVNTCSARRALPISSISSHRFHWHRALLGAKARAMNDKVSFGYEEVSPEEEDRKGRRGVFRRRQEITT